MQWTFGEAALTVLSFLSKKYVWIKTVWEGWSCIVCDSELTIGDQFSSFTKYFQKDISHLRVESLSTAIFQNQTAAPETHSSYST